MRLFFAIFVGFTTLTVAADRINILRAYPGLFHDSDRGPRKPFAHTLIEFTELGQ